MTGEKAVVSVAAGGLHSVCLHRDGTVSTWGANDENALGRDIIDDDDTHLIKPMEKIKDAVQISAGDSHTTVLDIHGKVHVCGMYKDVDSGMFRDLKSPQDTNVKGNHQYPLGKSMPEIPGTLPSLPITLPCTRGVWATVGSLPEAKACKCFDFSLEHDILFL